MKQHYLVFLAALGLTCVPAKMVAQQLQVISRSGKPITGGRFIKVDGVRKINLNANRSSAVDTLSNTRSNVPAPQSVQQRTAVQNTESQADSVVLYGFNQHANGSTALQQMAYRFHSAPSLQMEQLSNDSIAGSPSMVIYGAGKYYVFFTTETYDETTYMSVSDTKLKVYDARTLQLLKDDVDLGAIQPLVWGNGTYDASTGNLYFFAYNADYDRPLYTLDTNTFKLTEGVKPKHPLSGLACTPDGTLYGFNAWDSMALYTVDKTTGALTKIGGGDAKFGNNSLSSSLAYDAGSKSFYAVRMHNNFTTHLYKVDAATGASTLIADMPGNAFITGLHIAETALKAPAAPTHIKLNVPDGKLSGTLTFTAPTRTFDGTDALEGTLTACVTIDGDTAKYSVAPGAEFSAPVNLGNGPHSFTVQVGNSVGLSQERQFNYFAGVDVPGKAVNAQLSIDASTGKSTVKWQAPTATSAGGQLDASTVTYRVIRMPQNVVVAQNLKDTTFSETLGSERAHYYYNIVSLQGTAVGDTASTNKVLYGNVYEPPFTDTFGEEADMQGYTQVGTWIYDGAFGTQSIRHLAGSATDKLITPAIHFTTKRAYKLYFRAIGGSKVKVLLGNSATFTGNEQVIGEYTTPAVNWAAPIKPQMQLSSDAFDVPADGDYYLAFQTDGETFIDDIQVDTDAVASAPAAVGNFAVTAGSKGALQATISFTAPTKNFDGSAISQLSKVVIYDDEREQHVVKSFEQPNPGEQLSFTVDNLEAGNHTYTVRAFDAAGKGHVAKGTAYVGIDTPVVPATLALTAPAYDRARLSWPAATAKGVNGGYVDTNAVTYTVYRKNADTNEWDVLGKDITTPEFTDSTYNLPTGQQQAYVTYAVAASNATGTSEAISASIVVGTPYALPYSESFVENALTTLPWSQQQESGDFSSSDDAGWNTLGRTGAVHPYDEDGGLVKFTNPALEPMVANIMSPRVKMQDGAALTFFMYHGVEADPGDCELQIYASADDNAQAVKLATFDYNDGTTGWQRHVVSLDALKGADNFRFYLRGVAADASASIYVDHIVVDKFAANDLAVEQVAIPERVNEGADTTFTATVRNEGSTTADGYEVQLLRNAEVVDVLKGSKLEANAAAQYVFKVNAPLADAGKSYNYQVKVAYAADGKTSNNASAEAKVYVAGPVYPRVTTLQGSVSGKQVKLTWQSPEAQMTDAVTDGFEDYQEFIIDSIGDWKVVDGDKYETMYYDAPEVPHEFEPKAWWVWNSYDAGFHNTESVKAHSGKQQLAAFSACGTNDELDYIPYPNKDWLISPEITPGSNVSFWVSEATAKYGPETFQVLYSATTQDVKSFKAIGSGKVEYPGWIQYTYTLPDDARYFAILHNTRTNGQVMFLDDVTYTPLYGSTTDLSLTGYNVYRDGKLLAHTTDASYTDELPADGRQHVYSVSTVWAEGESMLGNEYTTQIADGIAATNSQLFSISSQLGELLIHTSRSLSVRVFTPSGKLVYSAPVNGNATVQLAAGAYLVKVGGSTVKTVVR